MTDPFDALHLDPEPIRPSEDFVSELRRRIEGELGLTPAASITTTSTATGATMSTRAPRPAGSPAIVPYLVVNNAAGAIAFYTEVLGFESTGDPIMMDDGRVGHAELRVEDSLIHLADEFPEMGIVGPTTLGGTPISITLYVLDVDVTYALALDRGGVGQREPADQFYGARGAYFFDPFGHRWGIQSHLSTDAESETEAATPAHSTQAEDLWNEVGYYVINVNDLEASASFFGGLFGWQFAEPNDSPDGGRARHVESSIVPFGLHASADGAPTELIHPYFRVRDLTESTAKVTELGGTVISLNESASGGGAECEDPTGLRFDLWKPADGY